MDRIAVKPLQWLAMLIYLQLGVECPEPRPCQSRCGGPRWYKDDHEIVANPDLGESCLLLHRITGYSLQEIIEFHNPSL